MAKWWEKLDLQDSLFHGLEDSQSHENIVPSISYDSSEIISQQTPIIESISWDNDSESLMTVVISKAQRLGQTISLYAFLRGFACKLDEAVVAQRELAHMKFEYVLNLRIIYKNINTALSKLTKSQRRPFLDKPRIFSKVFFAPAGYPEVFFDSEKEIFANSPYIRKSHNFTDYLSDKNSNPRLPITPWFDGNQELVFVVNRFLAPKTKIFTDTFRIEDSVLTVKGHVYLSEKIYEANLSLLSRTSDFGLLLNTKFNENNSVDVKKNKNKRYDFEGSIDLAHSTEGMPEGPLDVYLNLKAFGYPSFVQKRVGISNFNVRKKSKPSHIKTKNHTFYFVPYYTFGTQYPTLQVEKFEHDAFNTLQDVLDGQIPKLKGTEKPVWLIGEVPYKAQDNGFWLFKNLFENHPEIEAYYVIDKASKDMRNLTGMEEKVLQYRSKDHIQKLVQADRIIGTHQPVQMFPSRDMKLRNKVTAKYVFLQHGVTAAKWIEPVNGKYSTDFTSNLIIVNSEREKEFFVQDCKYDESEVEITGFSRFDQLFAPDTEVKPNTLLVMPTWRTWLQNKDTFLSSDYFVTWSELLRSSEIQQLKESRNLEIIFCLHPNMQHYSQLFEGLGAKVVFQGEVDVQKLIKESEVMITDYSSVGFDFAFLEKPVIFYQFDANRLPIPHADPDTELPGPVSRNIHSLGAELRNIYSQGTKPSPEYVARANKFLKYKDLNNRNRTVDAIKNMPSTGPSVIQKIIGREETRLVQAHTKDFLYRHLSKIVHKRYFLRFVQFLLHKFAPINKNLVVFETNLARSFGDSPKAIFDVLKNTDQTKKMVVVTNRSKSRFDDINTTRVRRNSLKYVWYLSRAKYLVTNHNFADYIVRRKKAIFLQTWHGTPLKRMFLDQEDFKGRDPGYITRVKKMASQWNLLISPSQFFTEKLQSSYGYSGSVLELGHARNDILLSDQRDEVRLKERSSLGINDDRFVVLYAPTFRDNNFYRKGNFQFEWAVDLESFQNRFGKNAVLLVRKHNLIKEKLVIPKGLRRSVIDVSDKEDMAALMLASDMLVTDYSSSFFDYSLLGRPIVFYAYDLKLYRDEVRGFYLDYEKELPGPVIESENHLYQFIQFCIENTDNKDLTWIDQNFIKKYAPHDDGQVSQRIVDQVFG